MNGVMKVLKDLDLEQKNQQFDLECSIDVTVRLTLTETFIERISDIEGTFVEEL